MPSYRGISVTLQSQYDALTIPEHPLPPSTSAPKTRTPRNSISSLSLASTQISASTYSPMRKPRIINATVPTFPSSQFWITYTCLPPPPAKEGGDDVRYYYFKVFANEVCVVSWGVGEKEEWSGKTMYALFNAGTDFEGRKVVEKRGLFFPKQGAMSGDAVFEVRIFRAKARRREPSKYEIFSQVGMATCDLTSIGHVKKGEKQRLYTYALIDAKDEPFVTFRYSFGGSNDNHRDLSNSSLIGGEDPSSPVSERSDTVSELPGSPTMHASRQPNVEKGSPTARPRRLSFPPRRKLFPSRSHQEPSSPMKKRNSFDDARPKVPPKSSVERDWVNRTPSPMGSSLFDNSAFRPPERTKKGANTSLRGVVTSALRRK